jgi:transposase
MKKTMNPRKPTKRGIPRALEAIRPMVAGIDIASREHWVCGPAREDDEPNVRVFGTTTGQLEELVNWLAEQGVESVAMESTSVYWIPLYELLESRGIEAVLANARQTSNVPGRKTDFHDCQWIQLLHSCGLLRGSFRPGPAITAMRALHRQLANLVEERGRCVQWMQKALDQMNVQVHRAVADLRGCLRRCGRHGRPTGESFAAGTRRDMTGQPHPCPSPGRRGVRFSGSPLRFGEGQGVRLSPDGCCCRLATRRGNGRLC